ncbi:MAG TPA: carbon-nitrogen hydrolase family protein [Tepidisphaeraceae bacterium]|jgi:predicted amidohydrolase|nr:carbon-nitrogen hydrolase family protein [Tepidisphaeraceae bacterium]
MKRSLTIAAVQMVFRPQVDQNVALITDTIQRSAEGGADVILFPECAVTGYNRDFTRIRRGDIERALARIAQTARRSRCNVLVGSPTFAGRKRLNSLLVFDRRGREIFRYSKVHLTRRDRQTFVPGNKLALFHLDQIPCTAMICHERRFPELVRLPVMLGAQVLFHPNAGLDALEVSKTKHRGRDGMIVRAFENQVYYVFANSVGPQGDGLWSAGDSKIVAPDGRTLALADNRRKAVIHARVDLSRAGREYAIEALRQPAFLRPYWKSMLAACKRQLK